MGALEECSSLVVCVMSKKLVLQILLVLVGLFFVAGIYPLLTTIPRHQQSDDGDQMMLAVYFALGVFLPLAVRRPAEHRSLIAFTGWSSFAHDAVMAVQAAQLKQLRSHFSPFARHRLNQDTTRFAVTSHLAVIRAEPVVEVSRQIGSSISEASVCLQPLSHEDEAMLLVPVSKKSPLCKMKGNYHEVIHGHQIWVQ
jgi:hypothetical protein